MNNKEIKMNSITKTLIIVTTVLGLGTSNITAADESNIQQSLSHSIVAQGQQVTKALAIQLQQSIQFELNKFAKDNSIFSAKGKKTEVAKNNKITKTTTAED